MRRRAPTVHANRQGPKQMQWLYSSRGTFEQLPDLRERKPPGQHSLRNLPVNSHVTTDEVTRYAFGTASSSRR